MAETSTFVLLVVATTSGQILLDVCSNAVHGTATTKLTWQTSSKLARCECIEALPNQDSLAKHMMNQKKFLGKNSGLENINSAPTTCWVQFELSC